VRACAGVLVLAFLLGASPRAAAEAPLITEDARILDRGKCEIETLFARERHFPERAGAGAFACNPFGHAEFAIEGARITNHDTGTGYAYDLKTKVLLRELSADQIGMVIVAGVVLERPFMAEKANDPYARVGASMALLNERVTLHLNLGIRHDQAEDTTRGALGIAGELEIIPRLRLLAEVFGRGGEKATRQAGLTYELVDDRMDIYGTIGAQEGEEPKRRFYTLGVRVQLF